MSFMFHPNAYDDPKAVNHIPMPEGIKDDITLGTLPVAKKIVAAIDAGAQAVGIDGYPGTQFDVLVRLIEQQEERHILVIPSKDLLKPYDVLQGMLAPYLPEDRELDPVLLYGVRYEGGYSGLQDADRVEIVKRMIASTKAAGGLVIVYGCGALSEEMRDAFDLRVWMDLVPKHAVLNFKYGKATNLCEPYPLSYSATLRRCYYIDFECAMDCRWELIREDKIDLYINANYPDNMQMMPFSALKVMFDALNKRPFRCRPVYLEGVWGGSYVHKLRNLPDEMTRTAWIFDMIPLEVSLVADMDGVQFETPFFTFVQTQGKKLLGERAYNQFGGYFPIRFNYDDTYHSSGNMSIQCHPDADYVVTNHRELGRQDESYYVVAAGQGACTYLGFKEKDSCKEFFELADRAQHTGELIDYKKYINSVKSFPGTQVMIPAGTVHASGRNQVVLEIGSLTVGSYTYKLYDYQRLDSNTGKPRPIHLEMGRRVIHPERTADYVAENLVNHGYTVREGDGWREFVVGEHDLLYFSLRNESIEKTIDDDTQDDFHVLALVDGDKARVESIEHPELAYEMDYMDIVVVPATLGRYRIVNLSKGPIVIHKTLLKK